MLYTNLPRDFSSANVNPDDGYMLLSGSSDDESSVKPTPTKRQNEDSMDI